MTKVMRSYTLDIEIVNNLQKEHNASSLINDLLTNHYSSSRESLDLKKANLTKELEILKAEEKEVSVVEREMAKENDLIDRMAKAKAVKQKAYDTAMIPILKEAKAKTITFEQYRTKSKALKRLYGL